MLKLNVLNLTNYTHLELKNLFNLARIDINSALTYMERQRYTHEGMIRDLTTIVDHGDDWTKERAESQRLEELALSNAYYNICTKLKPYDTRRPIYSRIGKMDVKRMVKEINTDLDKKVVEKEQEKLEDLFTLPARKSVCAIS